MSAGLWQHLRKLKQLKRAAEVEIDKAEILYECAEDLEIRRVERRQSRKLLRLDFSHRLLYGDNLGGFVFIRQRHNQSRPILQMPVSAPVFTEPTNPPTMSEKSS